IHLAGRKKKPIAEDDLQFLPLAARKRLKKLEVEALKDQERIETLNSHALANCTTSDENLEDIIKLDIPTEKDITLKISYICDVSKIAVDKNEKFSKIYPKVADMYKLKANEILLYLRDEVIHLNDTPKSRNIKCWDIIECLPYKPLDKKNIETDSNIISIKMQSNDIKKRIEMHAHKLEKFQDIMVRYATLCNLPLKDLVFKFDGEQIDESDTPDALDMESGSCIDITILSLKSAPSTVSTHSENVQQIPEHEMLQICVLD
ncbi:NFATC2-interacting protein, partial [Caerostris extrusa]